MPNRTARLLWLGERGSAMAWADSPRFLNCFRHTTGQEQCTLLWTEKVLTHNILVTRWEFPAWMLLAKGECGREQTLSY